MFELTAPVFIHLAEGIPQRTCCEPDVNNQQGRIPLGIRPCCFVCLSSRRVHRQLGRAVDARVVAERGQRDGGPLLGERG